jgi:hypothetical protein
MGRTLTIDLDKVRLSPAEKLTLQNISNRQPRPAPVPTGIQQSLDEALGEPKNG